MKRSKLAVFILGLGLSFLVGVQSSIAMYQHAVATGAWLYWPGVLGLIMAALLFVGVLVLPFRPILPVIILALAADIGLLTGLFSEMNSLLLWGACAGLLTLFAFWVREVSADLEG